MRQDNIELVVLVRGRPIREYPYENDFYVEGRAGSNYEIEVRNHGLCRIEAIISVDGLSIMDGKAAGSKSRGYIVSPGASIRIPGWRLDGETAAQFAFSDRRESYAAHMNGGAAPNSGVIGLLAYPEKARPTYWSDLCAPSIYPSYVGSPQLYGGAHTSCVSAIASAQAIPMNAAEASLGTAFGPAAGFHTSTISFERQTTPLRVLSLYYDNAQGLRARGIDLGRRNLRNIRPNAFPAMDGCVPPPNWTR